MGEQERYAWSLDEEGYEGSEPSREVALECAIEAAQDRADSCGEPVRWVWTARVVPPDVRELADRCGDWMIDRVRDAAYNEAGEFIRSWLDNVSPDQERDLDRRIAEVCAAWVEEHGLAPRWFTVEDVEEHDVEIAGIAEDDGGEP